MECVVDAATQSENDQDAATEFFTIATRNLQKIGEKAGVRRIVVVSIVGTDRFTGGYIAAKVAHQELLENGGLLPGPDATLAGPTFEEWLDAQR